MIIRTINKNDENRNSDVKGKVIIRQNLTKQLLAAGMQEDGTQKAVIIDIKPDRNDPMRTVHVFRDDEEFRKILDQVLEERSKSRDVKDREIDDLKKELEELKKKLEEKE